MSSTVAVSAALHLDRDRSFVKFVFPFALAEEWPLAPGSKAAGQPHLLAEASARFENSAEWRRLSPMRNPQVLAHIRELLHPDPQGAIDAEYALALGLTNEALKRRFPSRGELALVLPKAQDGEIVRFEVREVELYLFRVGVGLLALEISVMSGPHRRSTSRAGAPPPTPEDLVLFNHYFRRVSAEQDLPRIEGLKPTPMGGAQEESSARGTLAREVLRTLLAPLGEETRQWRALAGDRLIPFTFGLLGGGAASRSERPNFSALARLLYCLRRGYDFGYEPAPSDLADEGNPEVLPTFRNIAVGASSEGAALLAVESDEPFVRDGLPARVRNTYFPLFLLAVQQRLVAIHLAAAIASAVRARGDARGSIHSSQASIRRLRDHLFDFIVRGWYAEVSHEPQHAACYALWQRAFRVDGLLAEVKTEIEELDEYLHRIEADRQSAVINILTLVATPLVLAFGFWGMNFMEVTGISMKEPWVWGATGLFYAFYLGVAMTVRWFRGRR